MAFEEEPQEETPAPPAPPEPPPVDINAAIEAVSQHYGWDPRAADFEIREIGQRKARLEQKERELQALEEKVRRSNSFETPPGYEQDPTFRTVAQLAQEMREDREERRREREESQRISRLTQDLNTGYDSLMARVPNKVDRAAFFNSMLEVYPDQALLERVGIDRAVSVVYRYMSAQPGYSNGNAPPSRNRRDQQVVIPSGITGGAGPPDAGDDTGPQRSGETLEAYSQRLGRVLQERGIRGISEGAKVRSE